MRRPLAIALCLAAAIAAPADGEPLAGDYELGNPEWNGLSDLESLADSQGLDLVQETTLDWDEVDPEVDVVFMLYPTERPEPSHVASFVRGGGRLLIADDFGQSDEALARLGILRRTATGVNPTRWHEDNPALPVASAWEDRHPLAEGAEELVTNHPSVFQVESGPDVVFGFGKGEGVVVAGELGDGRFVALSDPSVLINGMLAFDGNMAFAANLLRWLTPDRARDDGSGRVIVVTHDFLTTGSPPDVLDGDLTSASANRLLREVGKYLDELNDYIASHGAMRAVGIVGAFALLLLGAAVLPFRSGQKLDGAWTRAHLSGERVDFEKLVDFYDRARAGASFAFPAAVLREAVDQRLAALIGVAEPLAKLHPADLLHRVERRAGAAAATALYDVLDKVRVLPTREQAQAPWGARHVGRREFDRIYDGVQALERALGNVPLSGARAPGTSEAA